ncbi:MAG: TRAP transporter TatT component family protein, partial [Myxococcota bacterium]
LVGCAALTRPITNRIVAGLSTAILDQNDRDIVRDGAPAYLLAIDGLIESAPDDTELLLTGARLYGAYASAFVEDATRRRKLTDRALGYARRALCQEQRKVCEATERPYDEFVAALGETRAGDLASLYGFGAAWAGWVQAHADDWAAVAEIPKIEALMERVVALDEGYEDGGAHLYLGVLLTQRPASLGGKPEQAREHFERAVTLSEERNLMAKVLYAQQYARLVFDRPLHDRLLGEVVAADPEAPGLTLSNTLAQEQARVLLADADEYF